MTVKCETPEISFENIPKGYKCIPEGVQRIPDNGDPVWIARSPVVVTALSRDEFSDNWGVLIEWIDRDGKKHERAIPRELFNAQGGEVARMLSRGGGEILAGKEKELLWYLGAFRIEERLVAATCTGWLGDAFVLPQQSINEPEGERIVYQPTGLSNTAKAIASKGSLDAWQRGMTDASSMVIFFVCASLSAPVRYRVGIEAGGFHAFNLTSQGKTTMLQAASSVWGNGVDPAIAGGDEAYIQRWNSTANALEAKAETFNDLAFIIDEIGEGNPNEFGRTIYRVISGSGRGRADRSGGLRNSKSWRVTILSAGEVAVSDFIASGGVSPKGGQMVRMVDLDLSVIGNLFDDADQANAMKKLCATHYGHAGPAMLKAIPDLADGWDDFDRTAIGNAVTSIAQRARARFALVAYTGVIAARAGILPWTESKIMDAVKAAYSAWHDRINIVSDIDRGVVSVRDFILKHESLFESPHDLHPPRDRAGWVRDGIYHFTAEAFKESCKGCDSTRVKRALKEAGLLHLNRTRGLVSEIKVNGENVRVISVRAGILSDALIAGGDGNDSGDRPCSTAVSGVVTREEAVATDSDSSVETDNSVVTVATNNHKVATAESLINKGLSPQLSPLPSHN